MVLGFRIGKTSCKLLVEALRGRDLFGFLQQPRSGDLQELLRGILDALLHPRLARLPVALSEPVELYYGILCAVARQDLNVFHRHIELVVAVIEHLKTVVGRSTYVQGDQALVTADSVIDVNHEVASLQAETSVRNYLNGGVCRLARAMRSPRTSDSVSNAREP